MDDKSDDRRSPPTPPRPAEPQRSPTVLDKGGTIIVNGTSRDHEQAVKRALEEASHRIQGRMARTFATRWRATFEALE